MNLPSEAFRVACLAFVRKAEMLASRVLNAFLSFLPDEIDRRAYDNKSYRAVLRVELERQEQQVESHKGYFPRVPDSAFTHPKVLTDYLVEYLLSFHQDLPEVNNPTLLADLPLGSVLLRDLANVYGMYKVRSYLKRCFGMSYAEWKAAHDAEQKQAHSNSRRTKNTMKPAVESKQQEGEPLSPEPGAESSQKPLGTEEAADYLGITLHALYKLTSQRRIKHSKPTGRKIYFSVADLDEWAKQNKVRTVSEIQAEVKEQEWKQGKGKRR